MHKTPFGFESPEQSPGFLLWQTTILWQRLIRTALEPFDISHPQFVILAVLLWFEIENETPNQLMLIQQTKLDKMTVSKSLKKLASSGLIERHEHTEDARAKSVHLTGKGVKLIKKLIPIVEAVDIDFFAKLTRPETKLLLNHLAKLTKD